MKEIYLPLEKESKFLENLNLDNKKLKNKLTWMYWELTKIIEKIKNLAEKQIKARDKILVIKIKKVLQAWGRKNLY